MRKYLHIALLIVACGLVPQWSWGCVGAFDKPLTIAYKPGTRIEVSFALDINPHYSVIYASEGQPEELVHFHRFNGEDYPFRWPPNHTFVEGASARETSFFARLYYKIFERGIHWEFYPDHHETSLWKSVVGRMDRVIDLELKAGSIGNELATFAKNYHRNIMQRHVSHIFLQIPPDANGEESWETLSIVHGGGGGGNFAGPYQSPYMRRPEKPSLLQIEESFPELRLPERVAHGDRAEIYEFVRTASVNNQSASALDQLAPVVARHLAQKNGLMMPTAPDAAIYILAPTAAHERHYVRFFEKRGIPIAKIADVGDGYKVYRIPVAEFVYRYLVVQFRPA